MKHKRWLITGASGFIGGAVARLAVQSGIRTGVMTRHASPGPLPGVVLPGSLASPDWTAIEEFKPEICIHCAWTAQPGIYMQSTENPALAAASIAFAKGLFQRGVVKFIGLGSCAEYAPDENALQESAPRSTNPSPYVQAKLAALDGIAAVAPSESAFSWLRIFYPYGPGEPPQKFLTSCLKTFTSNRELTLNRPGDIVDYIHIDDVASAIHATARMEAGGIFNIGSGRPLKVRDAARAARTAVGGTGAIFENEQPDHVSRFADIKRLRALGWSPAWSLEEGLRSMLGDFPPH